MVHEKTAQAICDLGMEMFFIKAGGLFSDANILFL
jgi:hypothetical protein